MREKLIELLSDAELPIKSDGRIIGWYALDFDSALYMADHLIANGVTIPTRCKDCKKEWCYLRQELGPEGFCSGGEMKP